MSSTPARMRAATEQDILGAIVALGSLPRRETVQADLDLEAYKCALEGVPAAVIVAAVRGILQGALGHPFMPGPAELRLYANRLQSGYAERAVARRRRFERQAEDMRFEEIEKQRTDASKARVAAMVERFKRGEPYNPESNDLKH